ncbi:MAG TPA: class I SAM-dependent methyltransferase, partial [Anaerolineales bacterium]|nr:class I SAM-dependent methyltransferase [Anaerolineales bacterium]
RQMLRLASGRLRGSGLSEVNLARGLAQSLPFAPLSFDTVVSTFPAEYIYESGTLHEVRRVLAENGVFVVLPAAWIIGRKIVDRAAAWLFRTTDQAPQFPAEMLAQRLSGRLEEAGFAAEFETAQIRSSEVLVVIARKVRTLTG